MKFTEEKLEKAYTMVNDQLLMVNEWKRPTLTINHLTLIIKCQVFCSINLTISKCPVFLLINWTNQLSLQHNKKNENS